MTAAGRSFLFYPGFFFLGYPGLCLICDDCKLCQNKTIQCLKSFMLAEIPIKNILYKCRVEIVYYYGFLFN